MMLLIDKTQTVDFGNLLVNYQINFRKFQQKKKNIIQNLQTVTF